MDKAGKDEEGRGIAFFEFGNEYMSKFKSGLGDELCGLVSRVLFICVNV